MYDSIVGELFEQTIEVALVERLNVFPDGRWEVHVGMVPKSVTEGPSVPDLECPQWVESGR
jgi:hypothetical protein